MNQLNRAAVIGLGNISDRHRKNLKILNPDTIVYALSSSGRTVLGLPLNADFVADSIDVLLKLELDLVIVASPATYHLEHAIPFVLKGIPVLIEKPIVASFAIEDIRYSELVNSKRVGVGYCLRYMPAVTVIKNLLGQDALGEIYSINIQVGQYLPDWRKGKNFRQSVSASKSLGGGVLLELSHELDYAQWLFGDLELQYANARMTSELALEVEDIADMVFTTDNGAVCFMHLDFLQKVPQRACTIIAENGRVDWDLNLNSVHLTDRGGKREIFSDPNWDRNEMYVSMLKDFIVGCGSRVASVKSSLKLVEKIDEIKRYSNGKVA